MEQLKDRYAVKRYVKSLHYTIEQLKECLRNCEIHKKEFLLHHWPDDNDVKELNDALQKIDPNYSEYVQSWNQTKKKIPLLYEFVETHCIHDLECAGYLSEITISRMHHASFAQL
eukprot:7334718-Ditylum_brightwellii.AAC.1